MTDDSNPSAKRSQLRFNVSSRLATALCHLKAGNIIISLRNFRIIWTKWIRAGEVSIFVGLISVGITNRGHIGFFIAASIIGIIFAFAVASNILLRIVLIIFMMCVPIFGKIFYSENANNNPPPENPVKTTTINTINPTIIVRPRYSAHPFFLINFNHVTPDEIDHINIDNVGILSFVGLHPDQGIDTVIQKSEFVDYTPRKSKYLYIEKIVKGTADANDYYYFDLGRNSEHVINIGDRIFDIRLSSVIPTVLNFDLCPLARAD